MNQSINTDSKNSKNSKEPQQKYRLGTVSIKILGGLNRFYRRLTSPSASIMAQNIRNFICFPLFDNVYCFKNVYIHFFLFVHDSFLCSIRKYGEERPICACVKTWHGSHADHGLSC